jgi:CRISPR/Cas system endoribonuclease Cas6 (RAMP superfamily)
MRPIELSIAKNGLHILHEIFRLECYSFRSPRLSDVVLIAIDFENINTIKSGFSHKNNYQVSLAVLDTKEINQVSPDKLISTYNFATGSPSYLRKASEKFIFGETITIRPSDLADCI